MLTLLFLVNVVATAIMTGVIWTIQIVHYPFFHRIEMKKYSEHMDEHRKKISYIVIPVMLAELGSAIGLVLMDSSFTAEFAAGLILLTFIWISTALFQVPSHSKLASGYSASEVNRLVNYNWIRTLLWTARLAVMLFILSRLAFVGLR